MNLMQRRHNTTNTNTTNSMVWDLMQPRLTVLEHSTQGPQLVTNYRKIFCDFTSLFKEILPTSLRLNPTYVKVNLNI